MLCEVCGRSVKGRPFSVKIEGAVMRVCERCARYGEETKPVASMPKPVVHVNRNRGSMEPKPQSMGFSRKPRPPSIEELEVIENFAEVMRDQRRKYGMTQDEFGKFLFERSSLINKVETGSRVPPFNTVRKFEKKLGIKLLTRREKFDGLTTAPSTNESIRLGDVVRIRKK